jgi:hypothetical protein
MMMPDDGQDEIRAVRGRQGRAPFCPDHPGNRCRAGHSTPSFTRYYCRVPGCRFSMKLARPTYGTLATASDGRVLASEM